MFILSFCFVNFIFFFVTGTVFQGDSLDLNFEPAGDTWGEDYDYTGNLPMGE